LVISPPVTEQERRQALDDLDFWHAILIVLGEDRGQPA
jgi:hypothetical protein